MDIWQIIGASAGGAIGVVGLWVLRGGKRVIAERSSAHADEAADAPIPPAEDGLSGPTRLTLGVACLLVGYHLVCWSVPAISFGVPVDLWWIVAAGAALAVVGAFAVDSLERRPAG
jgi:hypothetical protein